VALNTPNRQSDRQKERMKGRKNERKKHKPLSKIDISVYSRDILML
jgi:hypothetical protein